MSAVTSIDDIFTFTENKLTAHFQNNEQFNRDFAVMYEFYRRKFEDIIKEEDLEEFENYFFQSVKSQYFNGYYIFRELIANIEVSIPDVWYAQTDSVITEQIPDLIRQAAGEAFEEVIITDTMHELTIWLIQNYENIHDLIKQVAFDIVCLGAKRAILDEREQKQIKPFESGIQGFLGPIGDLTFLDPQRYITCMVKNEQTELWDIRLWSSASTHNDKIGEIYIISVLEEGTKYLLNIYLKNSVSDKERQTLVVTILSHLMERNQLKREEVQVNFAVIDEFFIFVHEE
jgi:hypothetical protein